jgi:hypothetical protein
MLVKRRNCFGSPEKKFALSVIVCPYRIARSTFSDIDREPLPAKRAPAGVTKTSGPFESRIDGARMRVVFAIREPDRDNRVSVPSSPVPIPNPDTTRPEEEVVIFPPTIARSVIVAPSPVPIPDPDALVAVQLAVIFPLTILR